MTTSPHHLPPKIVIVEDDIPIQQMYKFKLEKEGYEVATASDGVEGLAVIKQCKPDLILLDLRMPKMSGNEMLEELRTHDWAASIRVIILTNISRDEAPMNLRFLNVDRYIVKASYTPKQVVEIVDEVLKLNEKASVS